LTRSSEHTASRYVVLREGVHSFEMKHFMSYISGCEVEQRVRGNDNYRLSAVPQLCVRQEGSEVWRSGKERNCQSSVCLSSSSASSSLTQDA
jgi:hypothetical protein